MSDYDYAKYVPKNRIENIKFRRMLHVEGLKKRSYAREIMKMCARDILFFTNTMVWTVASKDDPKSPIQPFITWPKQDDALIAISKAIGKEDVCVKKSRDVGGTWCCLIAFFHSWLFDPHMQFLLLSRKEDYVDKKNFPQALFWKLDFMLKYLPPWMRPNIARADCTMRNLFNESTFTGEPTTGDCGTGGKFAATMWDEVEKWPIDEGFKALSALSGATNCRILNSSVNSKAGVFYKKCMTPKAKVVSVHWTDDPQRCKGLYIYRNDDLEIIDKKFEFPHGYNFVKDGTLRSPYYDTFEMANTPAIARRELGMDFGNTAQFFDIQNIQKLIAQHARRPLHQGTLVYKENADPSAVLETQNGGLRIWTPLRDGVPIDIRGEPFAIFCDVSAGTGASNSVCTIASRRTGRMVAELTTSALRPERFAVYCVALARLFNDAYLGWEAAGPGRQFGAKVVELGYRNLYFYKSEKKLYAEKTDIPGWWPNDENKKGMLADYELALAQGKFINHSRESLEEMNEFIWDNDLVVHSKSLGTVEKDGSGSGKNHGDRVISAAGCWMLIKDRPVGRENVEDTGPVKGSIEWRIQQAQQEEEEAEDIVSCEF